MPTAHINRRVTLSVVIPCFNEEATLETCVDRVLEIADDDLRLEVMIVDDCSTDRSVVIAERLAKKHSMIQLRRHEVNRGKGAALRTGFREVTGDFVAVQDADLEYDPKELRRLLVPLISGEADVVLGSRFLSPDAHRVLYFWHSVGNKFITLLSNMFTDLNLTDIETCYKVFRREVIQSIEIEENRFGFEPEIVAKIAHMRLRVFEIGISYYGRTYAEGKKIGVRDGFRALYCICRYNAHHAPIPIQFMLYVFIGGTAAAANLLLFLLMYVSLGIGVFIAAPIAFVLAAGVNYVLCIWLLFQRNARWHTRTELLVYIAVVGSVGVLDAGITALMIRSGTTAAFAKLTAAAIGLALNFAGRRYFVFPEPASGPWKPRRGWHAATQRSTKLIEEEGKRDFNMRGR